MKKILLICILFANTSLYSQGNWEVIDIPNLYNVVSIGTLYYDSVTSSLWMGGFIRHQDSVISSLFNFVLKYDGTNWSHYGPFLGQQITSIIRFQDKIVIGGSFFNYNDQYATPDEHRSIAYVQADTVGHFEGMGAVGFVAGLNVINDELYAFGSFDTICGIVAHDAAKYNGTEWSNIYDFPKLDAYIKCGVMYNDKMYVAGGFSDLEYFGESGYGITYYENPDWVLPDGALNYSAGTYISDIADYQNELYVAGQISKLSGNAGNGIQKWNGSEWSSVGDHIRGENGELGNYDPIWDIEVHDNELYIAGKFEFAGNIPAHSIVRWDGQKYCSFGGTFDVYNLQALAFKNDTLYVAGGFYTIDGIQTHQGKLAKYIGGNTVVECSTVDLKENDALLQLDIYPSPAINEINIYLPQGNFQNLQVEVYNLLGQKMQYKNANTTENKKINISIQNFSKGQYKVLLKEKGVAIGGGRFIKE